MTQRQPFTREEREQILAEYCKAILQYNVYMDKEEFDKAEIPRKKRIQLEDEYYKKIPRVAMSCCPFDGKPLVRTFDPYGFDGLWWHDSSEPKELPCCTHFCVLRGAVNYNGLKPEAGDFEVRPGPEVPYVIPRLLELPDVVAVISKLEMYNGYTAYPIAYFATKRPPDEELTASWARKIYTYKTQMGEHGWKYDYDKWDFDLASWIEKGKVFWCPPDSDNTAVTSGPPNECPYFNLPGVQKQIFIEKDSMTTTETPDGEPISPYDWD